MMSARSPEQQLTPEQIAKIASGKVLRLPTEIVSSTGLPVVFRCLRFLSEDEYTDWMTVTAVVRTEEGRREKALGFVDGYRRPDEPRWVIESSHMIMYSGHNDPYADIRVDQALSDGLYVLPAERKREIGRRLMRVIAQALLGLGGQEIIISQPKKSANKLYEHLGYSPYGYGDLRLDLSQSQSELSAPSE